LHKRTLLKSNMEHVGKPTSKFSLEIITISEYIFGDSSGKLSYKAVARSATYLPLAWSQRKASVGKLLYVGPSMMLGTEHSCQI